MTYNSNRPSMFPFQAQAELELLQLMLQDDSEQLSAYPWNPAAPEAEAYFEALEQEVVKAGWTADELLEQGQVLSGYLNQLWTDVAPVETTSQVQTYANLLREFATQAPQQLLDTIAQRAQQVVATNLSLADQMVQCVQTCLPNWAEEDLQVLARPFAYAMRGADTEALESALRSVRCAAWTELSGIEQARLSLAIARYAIAQMPAEPAE
jgi:cell division septum initiation protein DivIVA